MTPSKCMIRRGAQIVWPASSKCEPTVAWLLLSILGGAPKHINVYTFWPHAGGFRESLPIREGQDRRVRSSTCLRQRPSEKLTVSRLMKVFSTFYEKGKLAVAFSHTCLVCVYVYVCVCVCVCIQLVSWDGGCSRIGCWRRYLDPRQRT